MYKAICISFCTKQINTPQAGKYRDHPCLAIYDVIISLFFPLQEDVCLTGSAAKGHHSLFLPHPGQFLFPFSPGFISSSCREQTPKSIPQAPSTNFQERKCCCGLKAVLFFSMLSFKILQQSRAMTAAVLVSGWQSQGSDGAKSRQRRASRGMDF